MMRRMQPKSPPNQDFRSSLNEGQLSVMRLNGNTKKETR